MTYLVDPQDVLGVKPCPELCRKDCRLLNLCAVKPLYGITP
jgi:hypothetical protein